MTRARSTILAETVPPHQRSPKQSVLIWHTETKTHFVSSVSPMEGHYFLKECFTLCGAEHGN